MKYVRYLWGFEKCGIFVLKSMPKVGKLTFMNFGVPCRLEKVHRAIFEELGCFSGCVSMER